MPREDGTGPIWARGYWKCQRGSEQGFGAGFGWDRRNVQTPESNLTQDQEISMLKEEQEFANQELAEIKARLKELSKHGKT